MAKKHIIKLSLCSTPGQMQEYYRQEIEARSAALREKIVHYARELCTGTDEDHPLECKVTLELPEPHMAGLTGPVIRNMFIDDDDNLCVNSDCFDERTFCGAFFTTEEMLEIVKALSENVIRADDWYGQAGFDVMERISGLRQFDFSDEYASQDFVDAVDAWWGKLPDGEKIRIWRESV